MEDWLTEALAEVAALEIAQRDGKKTFYHRDGRPGQGSDRTAGLPSAFPDGEGIKRTRKLLKELNLMTSRLGKLVTA